MPGPLSLVPLTSRQNSKFKFVPGHTALIWVPTELSPPGPTIDRSLVCLRRFKDELAGLCGACRASRMGSRRGNGTNSAKKLAHYAISGCSTKASPIWLWRFRAAAEQKTSSGARSRRAWQYIRAAFLEGLSAAGFVDGKNVVIEYHWADAHLARVPALTLDLIRRRVDVLFASGVTFPSW